MKKLLAAILATVFLTGTANAALQCTDRDRGVERLAVKYGEVAQVRGLDSGGRLVEVYANEVTGTWSLTFTTPEGEMCFVSSGEYYILVKELLKEGELN